MFRRVTLENEAMKAVVRDLQVHHDPVGKYRGRRVFTGSSIDVDISALQSMVICKQPHIGGEGT